MTRRLSLNALFALQQSGLELFLSETTMTWHIDIKLASNPGERQPHCCREHEDVGLVDSAIILMRLIDRARNNTQPFHDALRDLCADKEFRHLLLYCQTRGYFTDALHLADESTKRIEG